MQTIFQLPHAGADFLLVGAQQFSGRRGCGGAPVGDKIAYDNVDLVPDSGYHGDAAGVHRARHRLFIERPQVLERTAATGQQQHVALAASLRRVQGRDNLLRGRRALHRHRIHDDRNGGETPAQHGEHVADRRAGR